MSTDTDKKKIPSSHPGKIAVGGGYRNLQSFKVATRIYDETVRFCRCFIDARSRTVDQMIQAARSGRQNIAEGSRAGSTSRSTELRLVNVARASLDELLLDYEDYLRQGGFRQWDKDSTEALAVRRLGYRNRTDRSDPSNRSDPYHAWFGSNEPEKVANALICLIHQANFLLDRQVAALERAFIESGGYRESLAAARLAHRQSANQTDRSDPSDRTNASAPDCPACGKPMVLRTAGKGKHAGKSFWGCSSYPRCRKVLNIE